MIKLRSTASVLDYLGGDDRVANLLGTTTKAVGNWRYAGLFPNHTYVAIKKALNREDYDAIETLWPMTVLRKDLCD